MIGLRLSSNQIQLGADALDQDTMKLKPSQVDDLVSTFRDYLGSLATNYSLDTDLNALQDTLLSNKCAKLSACLLLWQDNEFLNGGFAATNANRTGLNYSIDEENYKIFRYAFGLLYNLPAELDNKFIKTGSIPNSSAGLTLKLWTE